MQARLISLCGHPTISLTKTLTLVGRHPSCDVRIGSSRVSGCHCCLVLDSGDVIVRDLNSTNGTHVNGQSIHSSPLKHGDLLTIAHLRYRVSLEGSAGCQPPALEDDHSRNEPDIAPSTSLEIVPLGMKEGRDGSTGSHT
jgi:hypothetical protein